MTQQRQLGAVEEQHQHAIKLGDCWTPNCRTVTTFTWVQYMFHLQMLITSAHAEPFTSHVWDCWGTRRKRTNERQRQQSTNNIHKACHYLFSMYISFKQAKGEVNGCTLESQTNHLVWSRHRCELIAIYSNLCRMDLAGIPGTTNFLMSDACLLQCLFLCCEALRSFSPGSGLHGAVPWGSPLLAIPSSLIEVHSIQMPWHIVVRRQNEEL